MALQKGMSVGSGGQRYLHQQSRPATLSKPVLSTVYNPFKDSANLRSDAVVGGAGPNTGGNPGGYSSGRL